MPNGEANDPQRNQAGQLIYNQSNEIGGYFVVTCSMKTKLIIIGLTLSVMVWGQVDFREWERERNALRKAIRVEMYYLMSEYINYCYTDSSVERYIISYPGDIGEFWFDIVPPNTIHPSDVAIASSIDTLYSHRQPTFEGYVIWLGSLLR